MNKRSYHGSGRDRALALSSVIPYSNQLDPADTVPLPRVRFTPRKSSPRMPSFDYRGSLAYHIVISTKDRAPSFQSVGLIRSCVALLERSAAQFGFAIEAYCFMPDHLHLLVLGGDGSSLTRFVQHFKQTTGYKHHDLWQRSYYDHIVRREEAIGDVARYIWANPVVAGLAEDAADYPFSGPREKLLVTQSEVADRAKAPHGYHDKCEAKD